MTRPRSGQASATRGAARPAALLAAPPIARAAGPAPDAKDTWSGRTQPIVAGAGAHWPSNKGTFAKPGLPEGEVKITITGQAGHRFWGTKTITGGGATADEPFIGVLHGTRMREALIADTDGYMRGTFAGNVFSFCYAHAGGQSQTSLVTCAEARKGR